MTDSPGSTGGESGEPRKVAGRREFPDLIASTRIMALLFGVPALLFFLTMARTPEENLAAVFWWAAGFGALIVLTNGIRKMIYLRPRGCPQCGRAKHLRRSGVRESTERRPGDTDAWLDEWRCGACGYAEWLRISLYRRWGGD